MEVLKRNELHHPSHPRRTNLSSNSNESLKNMFSFPFFTLHIYYLNFSCISKCKSHFISTVVLLLLIIMIGRNINIKEISDINKFNC